MLFWIIVTAITSSSAGVLLAGLFSANSYDKGWQDCWNTFKGFANETEEDEEDV